MAKVYSYDEQILLDIIKNFTEMNDRLIELQEDVGLHLKETIEDLDLMSYNFKLHEIKSLKFKQNIKNVEDFEQNQSNLEQLTSMLGEQYPFLQTSVTHFLRESDKEKTQMGEQFKKITSSYSASTAVRTPAKNPH